MDSINLIKEHILHIDQHIQSFGLNETLKTELMKAKSTALIALSIAESNKEKTAKFG